MICWYERAISNQTESKHTQTNGNIPAYNLDHNEQHGDVYSRIYSPHLIFERSIYQCKAIYSGLQDITIYQRRCPGVQGELKHRDLYAKCPPSDVVELKGPCALCEKHKAEIVDEMLAYGIQTKV